MENHSKDDDELCDEVDHDSLLNSSLEVERIQPITSINFFNTGAGAANNTNLEKPKFNARVLLRQKQK